MRVHARLDDERPSSASLPWVHTPYCRYLRLSLTEVFLVAVAAILLMVYVISLCNYMQLTGKSLVVM